MKEISVIIPTYNEVGNIGFVIKEIQTHFKYYNVNGEIIVVDDNSPDGTQQIVRRLLSEYDNLKLIVRTEDRGLSQSVVEGFKHASSDFLIVMDGDGQHPVDLINNIDIALLNDNDIVVATRTDTPGWSLKRRIISWGATSLARILFPRVTDPGSGFFGINRKVIDGIVLKPQGYKILIEVLGRGRYETITEIPYSFKQRNNGLSKLRFLQIVQYVRHLLNLAVYGIFHGDSPVHDEVIRVVKFGLVGASGIAVNLLMLYSIIQFTFFPPLVGAGISVETSILTNFILNDLWTFKDIRTNVWYNRLGNFQIVSIVGLVINLVIFTILTFLGIWYIVAELVGILAAFIWNFVANRLKTWS